MKKGFTLIELLIVVAIIAILAAIAVPNFLEAQTRDKVSRTQSDLRTLATAMESYRVDNQNYPPTAIYDGDDNRIYPQGTPRTHLGGVTLITTPIAYLSTYTRDTFPIREQWGSASWNMNSVGRLDRPMMYLNIKQDSLNGTQPAGRWIAEYERGYGWIGYSVGPAGVGWNRESLGQPGVIPSVLHPYDPTNGTVSNGAIYRYGPGDDGAYR